MSRAVSVTSFILLASSAVFGQTTAPRLSFEVASIKPAPPPSENRMQVRMGGDAGRLDLQNVSLMQVITRAYGIKDFQVTGPDWLNADRFNIVAKMPEGTPKEQVNLMLQTLLEERFHLKVHHEEKVMQVYALVAGKNGPKLHPAEAESGFRMSMSPKGRTLSGTTTLANLASALSNSLDRVVVDQTGIKGIYDISLEWTPDEREGGSRMGMKVIAMGGGPAAGGGDAGKGGGEVRAPEGQENPNAPPLFTAIQESLGLKLEARKSPVPILIVDGGDRVPTEN
jgi:uncharacterized protein (TIGR03435 family)